MSGGFFRGTSADQDTRFSNKQDKLLKTQKFAAELEHLVDMAKVKMDVMRPWIANRVTELLGFEDEVLINFIYGLLDGKEVNGKKVQISLTGFMEKNTGKFMKELWTLLLSAQKNTSGIPQQFLDAKEEETRQKKEETDRIADEIRRKRDKDSRELEQAKLKKMDGGDEAKNADSGLDSSERLASKASNARSNDGEDVGERNGMRGRGRVSRSSWHTDRFPSSPRRSHSRSVSKSFSNSGSQSDERRRRSRSISWSPQTRGRSVSSEKVRHSPWRRSLTHWRRYSPHESSSPPRRRSSYYRRRSRSHSYHRSVSPIWRRTRSPFRRQSRPPVHRRSVTPVHHRRSSPVRYRGSPSPLRHRSPSPLRRRSHLRARSPSPVRHQSSYLRSPSPMGRRSSSPGGQKSLSLMRDRSPLAVQYGSPSLVKRRSPSPVRRRSPPLVRRRLRSPVRHRSPLHMQGRLISPARRRSPSPVKRQMHGSRSDPRQRSSLEARGRSPVTRNRRYVTPLRRSSNESSSPSRISHHSLSPVRRSPVIQRSPGQYSKGKMRERTSGKGVHSEISDQMSTPSNRASSQDEKEKFIFMEGKHSESKNASHFDAVKDKEQKNNVSKSPGKFDNQQGSACDTSFEESEKGKYKLKRRRKHKRSKRHEVNSDSDSYGSEEEERKEAKRRRKEEKKLRKEERHRRREERRRRKEERRVEKLKAKRQQVTDSSPLNNENHLSDDESLDGEQGPRNESHAVTEEPEKEQKKLEIELRMKALESFKAKKAALH